MGYTAVRSHTRRGYQEKHSGLSRFFEVGRLFRLLSNKIELIVDFFDPAVILATQVRAHRPIHEFLATGIGQAMSQQEALEHKVDKVSRIEPWVHGPQPLNAIEQPCIKTIGHLLFPDTVLSHVIDRQRQTLYDDGI